MSHTLSIFNRRIALKWIIVAAPLSLAARQGSASDLPPISLKQTQAVRIVYLEHTGPYWGLGPLFTPVQEEMAARKQSGPMVVRFSADPTATSPKSLRTQVGFFANGDWPVEAPFKSDDLEPMDVASSVVRGLSGTTTRHYSLIHEWIRQQGHETLGPIIEIYPAWPAGRKSNELQIEIQVPVRRAPRAEVRPAADAAGNPPPSKAELTEEVTPTDEAILPVKDLITAERYTRVAEQLMPTGRPIPAGDVLWFGQLIFRIGAVAKGLQQKHPDSAASVTALADALMSRYKAASAGSSADPLAQAVVRVNPAGDAAAVRKREIMRGLDMLLGRVATKAADPAAALNELAYLLQEIQDLTAPRQP